MKILVSALVGAVILFVYQAMSWMALGIHDESFRYTENQEAVMQCLNENLDEDAMYFLPFFDRETTTPEEQQKIHEGNAGKPWVIISYHQAQNNDMTGRMAYGFLSCFIICVIISMVLINIPTAGFGMRMFLVMSLGFLVMLGGPLYQANWFFTPSHNLTGELIDILLGYLLAGAWMSWWTGRS